MLSNSKKILVVGLGLMGGSYADALTKAGYEVGAITRSQSSIDNALSRGIIKSGSVDVTKEYIEKFDIVVFSLYPHTLIKWIEEYQQMFKAGALLTDVTGVKGSVVYKVQSMLRPDVEFIGAHPMAGKESSGVKNASADIFIGANYIVTPTSKNSDAAIKECEELGRVIGCTNISRLSPEKHDEMIGFLSQLTHCIAVSLMNCKDSKELVHFTGDSFRDLTRIANINDEMWSELFIMNKTELLKQMNIFSEQFEKLKKGIETENISQIKEMMRISTQRRGYFNN